LAPDNSGGLVISQAGSKESEAVMTVERLFGCCCEKNDGWVPLTTVPQAECLGSKLIVKRGDKRKLFGRSSNVFSEHSE
jgi:hypothetical protein